MFLFEPEFIRLLASKLFIRLDKCVVRDDDVDLLVTEEMDEDEDVDEELLGVEVDEEDEVEMLGANNSEIFESALSLDFSFLL